MSEAKQSDLTELLFGSLRTKKLKSLVSERGAKIINIEIVDKNGRRGSIDGSGRVRWYE